MSQPTSCQKQNVEKRVSAAQTIRAIPAADRDDVGFMARLLVLTTLPHSGRGLGEAWGRRNGDLTHLIQSGVYVDERGAVKHVGIPYGVYPRLVLAWLTTEAVRTKSRRIVLGSSLSEFMSKLDLVPTGGRWGTITRLRDQMTRLFSSRISATRISDHSFQLRNIQIADDADLFWDPKRPEQAAVWESTVVLGERFFSEITERPVPIDMHVLKRLTRSPLALDLYMWATYRVSYLAEPVPISWEQLHQQFGAQYDDVKNFAREVRRALKTIKLAWPELKYATPRGRLVLQPSPTHVSKLQSNNR